MKQPSGLIRTVMWILYAILLVINGGALRAILRSNAATVEQNRPTGYFDPVCMIAGLGLLAVGLVLFSVLKKRHGIALVVTLVAGVLLAINAAALGKHFLLNVSGVAGDTASYGMTTTKLLFRHWSLELIPFLMLLDWLRMTVPTVWQRMAHIPEAELIPADQLPSDTLIGVASQVEEEQLRCPLCQATFRNAVTGEVFSCPYCHARLRKPGTSWQGKKKRSVAVRERKKNA